MSDNRSATCDLLVFGETTRDFIASVDSLPIPEGAAALFYDDAMRQSLGGRAVNVATHARLFDHDVRILSACDDSYLEEYHRSNLRHASTGDVYRSRTTAKAWVFRDRTNHQMTFFDPGAAILRRDRDDPSSVSEPEATYKDHLEKKMADHRPLYLYCTSELHGFVEAFIQHYAASSTVSIFSPGPEVQLIKEERLRRILSHTSVLFFNSFEMQQVEDKLGLSLQEIMREYSSLEAVVITLGRAGGTLLCRSSTGIPETHWLPAAKPDTEVIDQTGAGDAVAGGFLGYVINDVKQGKSPSYIDALKYGLVVASFVVETYGTLVHGLAPDRVEARLRKYETSIST